MERIQYDALITDLAKQWDGWGTSLKPAHEPIMVAQKPRHGNYCDNVEKWGVGGLNIDDSRIEYNMEDTNPATNPLYRKQNGYKMEHGIDGSPSAYTLKKERGEMNINNKGRFPANVIFDEVAGDMLDKQSGILKSGSNCVRRKEGSFLEHGGLGKAGDIQTTYGDSGGASRFFYCPKSSKKDRTENGRVENNHPTVKPTTLIKYLVRLVTPPNGTCLDICEGSGTHAKACILLTSEGYPVNYVGFEKEKQYIDIANKRIEVNIKDIRDNKFKKEKAL
jgi:site-specific DNA-methyltransferase (adenine-specific)